MWIQYYANNVSKINAEDFSEHFERVMLNMHHNKIKLPTYVKKRKTMIITLWTFIVTAVPARPLSFCAAASPSMPSTLSPEVPKTQLKTKVTQIEQY